MTTLHLVSHTHWDREWYLPFQVYRVRLVNLIDNLLNILISNNGYAHYTLDGQTIILDDYLEARPEQKTVLARFVQEGRLSIGPWYTLPDEFLVSPEAIVRNLLQGAHTCANFGARMQVGYIPDPFGHIAQMPQILLGFGIQTACFQRGLSDQPCELIWESPDGSRVLTSYLRDGYGNAAYLALDDPGLCLTQIRVIQESLKPFSVSNHLLLMQGTDHTWPEPATPSAIAFINKHNRNDQLLHSSLPAYFQQLQADLERRHNNLPVIRGDLRDSRRSPLLPGVLSARMWIKQRNHTCQALLEKWAEPFCTFAEQAARQCGQPAPIVSGGSADLIRSAWRLLLQCQPHDSICGCSIDQVHEEMKPRFDQAAQIGEDLTGRALAYLASQVHWNEDQTRIVVFNPHSFACTGRVRVWVSLPDNSTAYRLLTEDGQSCPARVCQEVAQSVETLYLSRSEWLLAAGRLKGGKFSGQRVTSVRLTDRGGHLELDLTLGDFAPSGDQAAQLLDIRTRLVSAPPEGITVRLIQLTRLELEFTAPQVPGLGWRTFRLEQTTAPELEQSMYLENDYLRVSPDPHIPGALEIYDKVTRTTYPGLHTFSSGGDCGDEYNYCPPALDEIVGSECTGTSISTKPGFPELVLQYRLDVPVRLTESRASRSKEILPLRIESRVSLPEGLHRVDIHTTVWNACQDHRLRVHFPAPFKAEQVWSDGHFHIFEQSMQLPDFDDSWIEQSRPETYQRDFTTISDGSIGLTIANRGLPEVEISHGHGDRSEVSLTLLRCVGWLSRPDLTTRRGNAGPFLAAPGAQMQGRWEFDYAVIPHAGGWEASFQQAYAFNTPMRAVAAAAGSGSLPSAGQFFTVSPAEFCVTAVKTAEDGKGVILRGVNLGSRSASVLLKPGLQMSAAVRCRIDETPLASSSYGSSISAEHLLEPHQILTLRFPFLLHSQDNNRSLE